MSGQLKWTRRRMRCDVVLIFLGAFLAAGGAQSFDLKEVAVVKEVDSSPFFANQPGRGIALMSNGTRVVIGETRGAVDFDPSAAELIVDLTNITPYVAIYPNDAGPIFHAFDNPNNSNAYANFVALDDADNIYIVGEFNQTLGVGDGFPDLVGESADGFVARLNPQGEVQWAFLIGNDLTVQEINALAIRGNQLVIAGITQGNPVDFDPDPAGTAFAAGQTRRGAESYVASYTLDGEFNWVNVMQQIIQTGSGQPDEANGVAITASGEVLVAGAYNGTVDFDGGANDFLVETDSADGYFAKFDANGSPVWVRQLQSPTTGVAAVRRMAQDEVGRIIIAGYFVGTVDFDPDSVGTFELTSVPASSAERFIAEYDDSGGFVWARRIDSGGSLNLGAIVPIMNDRRLMVGGVASFGGSFVDFDPEGPEGDHSVFSRTDAFMVMYGNDGSFVQSVVLNGAASINGGVEFRGAVVDEFDIHVAGDFGVRFDADPGPGEVFLESGLSSTSDLVFGIYGFDQFFASDFEPDS